MVEKFNEILKEIEEQKGKVILFAIIKTNDLSDKWSVVFCAELAKDNNRDEVFSFIGDLFKKTLTQEENESIARIGIYQKDDYVVKSLLALLAFYGTEPTKRTGNCQLSHIGIAPLTASPSWTLRPRRRRGWCS